MCVCFDLQLVGMVCQYSELLQLWLVLPHDILFLYPWRLWQYYPIVLGGSYKAQYTLAYYFRVRDADFRLFAT